ncbi:hypothetical protein Pmani_034032 [Petrolisthes manimaculis]|uniref:Uncharacterized protein n=1 Tax=Petrolisthes manimaculis TaxID=1843537 RepID=A0AAE1NPR5_9EUCA|nr:hypothetical protein Pmani_034032 [Petrolisthes manimaculis]
MAVGRWQVNDLHLFCFHLYLIFIFMILILKKKKNGKVTGPDEIPVETVEEFEGQRDLHAVGLDAESLRLEDNPEEWSVIMPIYKE